MKNGNGYRLLKRWWFLIPTLLMLGFGIYSWVNAREKTEIRYGDKIQSLDDNYHELETDVDTNKKAITEIQKVQAVLKEKVTNTNDKIKIMYDDIKWLRENN